MSASRPREDSPEAAAADERLVEALREAQGSRAVLLKRLESAALLQSKVTELSKQIMAQSRIISSQREVEAELINEIAELKEQLKRGGGDGSAEQLSEETKQELDQLRMENTALKRQCNFLSDEVRTSVTLVSQASRRSKELAKMVATEGSDKENN